MTRANLVIIDDEAWTVDELRDALKRQHCPTCHNCAGHRPLLEPHQIAEIRRSYQFGRSPRGHPQSNARELAQIYGVSQRTITRYALHALSCAGPSRCTCQPVRGAA